LGSKVGSIAVGPEDHVTGMIADDGIGVGGTVIEELCQCFHGSLGPMGLLGGEHA